MTMNELQSFLDLCRHVWGDEAGGAMLYIRSDHGDWPWDMRAVLDSSPLRVAANLGARGWVAEIRTRGSARPEWLVCTDPHRTLKAACEAAKEMLRCT